MAMLLFATVGVQAQATWLCNEKFSSKKPSGWDILPAYSATSTSWKPDTGICMSEKYAMHGLIPYMSGDTATLVTPYFDCTNYKYVTIRFNHICKVLPADVCRIEYQEDVLGSGQKWKVIPYDAYKGGCATYRQDLGFSHTSYTTWDETDTFAKPTNSWWKQETFDVTDYAGYSKVRFRFIIRKGSYLGSFIAAGWYVDDFQVLVSNYKLNPPAVEFTKFYSDTVYSVGPYEFNAKVATRSEGRIKQPWLGYTATYEGKTKKDSIKMTDMDGGDSLWKATIPRHVYGTTFTYWINAVDAAGNSRRESGSFTNKYAAGGLVTLNGDSNLYGGTSTGIQNCSFPFMLAGASPSWVKVLYMAEHVRANKSGGFIGAMGFYTTYTAVNSHDNVKIYLKATNITSLTAISSATIDPLKDGAKLVYQGTVTGKQGWNQIKFDRGFLLPANMNLLWYVVDDDPKNACNSSILYWMRNSNVGYNAVDRQGYFSCSGTSSGTVSDLPTTMFYFGKAKSANLVRNRALNSYVYGMRTYYTDSFTVISNNEIVLKNTGTTSYGMYVYYTYDSKVANNSIILNGTATSYGMYVYTGSTAYRAQIHNNISVCLSSGTCYPNYFTSTTAASNYDVDYNCWWSKTNVGYVGAAKTSLAAFQTSMPSAVHDLYKQPLFTNSDSTALLKDNTGLLCTKVRGVDHDRRGMLRVAQTLMGAYTNELPKMNGALTEILNLPGTTMITDTVRPHVVLMNAGTETLTEATIRVELDGVTQGRDLVWKGKLAISEMDTIPIGNFILKTGNHRITAYLTGIGSLKDSIAADDTVHASTFTCSGPMAGSYHVGKNKGDFSTPAEAIRMINLCGISAPVTVSIQSGSYGAVSISGPVAGASSTNTITIIPDAGAKVVIDGGSGTAFSLQNSSHWHFRDITFGNTTNGMVGVELMGDVEDVSFRHCNIYASTTATASTHRAVSYPNASGATTYPVDVEFIGNDIRGGYYNMYLYYLAGGTGNMTASSITVDSNILSDAYYYGIYAYYYSHYKSMSYNTITNRKNSTGTYYGIYAYYYSNVDRMENNRIHVVTSSTGYGVYWYYYKNYATYGGSPGTMVNNEIMVEGNGGTKYGLYFYYPYQSWELYHNSIFVKSTSGTVYGIYAYNASSSYKITMKNNLFVTEGTGTNYPCYLASYYSNSYVTLDYNNYVNLSGGSIGYAGSAIATLSAWKTATGMDQNSVSVKPSFIDSTKNYELADYMPFLCPRLSSLTTDINGKNRTPKTTMGCYGFDINEDVDLQMLAILSPKPITGATCLPTSVPVKISYKNIGMKKADYSHSALKVSVDVTGAISHHFDTTFTKGTLDCKQEDSLTIGQIPTVANGIYRVKVTLTDTSDADNSNDTMSITYKMGRVSLPFDADFSTEPVEILCATMAGKTNWNVVKGTGSNPAVAPAFGTGRLEFAGENNSGDSANVVLNGMDLQGCFDPTLSFWYAHSATCSKNDMLTVLVTTDGGANYTEVKRILVADTMTGWKRHDIDLSAFKQASCLSIVLRATSFGGANQSIDRIRIASVKDATFSLLPIDISGRTACDNTPVDVKAVISNLSKLEVDMLNDTLTLNVSGAVSYSNKVVYNKLLGGFATDTVTLGQISFDANGKYNINAWMQSRDDRSANDTASDSSIFIMQEIALDTVLGFDNQTMKLVGDTVNVNAVVINNGNTTVGQVILHMSLNGNEVLADTVSSLLYAGDTLVHPMAFAVPSATKEEPFYFFEMIAELSCDADTSNNTVRMVGQVLIPDSIDIQVLEITTTEQALGNTKLSPSVRIANIGNIYADSVVLHVDVVNDSNRVLESISEVISHMDVNETLNYDFTMTYSVPDYTGKYTLKAYVEAVDGDSIQSNDTLATQFRCYRDSVGIADAEQLDWSLGQNIPNPASAVTAIPFTLPQAGTVRISIMTANGQVIYRQESDSEAGSNRIGIDASGWAAGGYYYTMEYRGQRLTRKMNITR